jgi:exopolyphosphatase / guanosine-5'-triphosphate,3'-diphosphate pyrophosphatase
MTAPRVRVLDFAPKGDATASQRVAAIDIGSNSIRQIIADVTQDGSIRVVDEMRTAPRLGADLGRNRLLTEDAMQSAIDALQRMATLARQKGAARIDAVATSAVRDAANQRLFLERVRRDTGLKVRVLNGEDEARLSFRSALAHFDLGVGRAVVIDIGGGSLELAMSADGVVERLLSLPYGAMRMTERFLGDQPRRKHLRRLRRALRDDVRRALPVTDWRGAQLIGSGGTFTNLAAMHLARRGLPFDGRVHGTRVTREELEHIIDVLLECTPEEREAVPGLNPARADIILGGLAVAVQVMARVEAREIICSGYGIREGILLESAHVSPAPADPGEARERSVLAFAERCHYEVPHAQHVQRLALQLFDALGPRLGCEPPDRLVLADAALLHDVGYHINYDRHHKHSFHLIAHAELLGVSPEEQVIIAHVARYHRGATPRRTHRSYAALDKTRRRRIRRLAAILRVADGLDRAHIGAVDRVKVRWLQRAIRLTVVPASRARTVRLELWGASRKSRLLEKVAGKPVEIVSPDGTVFADEPVGAKGA